MDVKGGSKDTTSTANQQKIVPAGYKVPSALDSVVYYKFNSTGDSIPNTMKHHYQDQKLNDTAIVTFSFDTLLQKWLKDEKRVFIEGNDEHADREITYSWDASLQNWFKTRLKRAIKSDTLQLNASYEWNPFIKKWIGLNLDSSVYYKDVLQSKHFAYEVDQQGDWIFKRKFVYENVFYNDSTILDIKRYRFNEATSQYEYYSNYVRYTNYPGKSLWTVSTDYSSSQIIDKDSTVIKYTDEGEYKKFTRYEYDLNSAFWQKIRELTTQYNDKGQKILQTLQDWNNEENKHIPVFKRTYLYVGDKIFQEIQYDWDQSDNDWFLVGRKILSYQNDNLIKSKRQLWDTTQMVWNNQQTSIFEYDEADRMVLESRINTDSEDSGDYYEVFRKEIKYTEGLKDDIIQSLYEYDWDASKEKLSGEEAFEYEFDSLGNIISETELFWNDSISDWIVKDKFHYYYTLLQPEDPSQHDTILVSDTIQIMDTILVTDTVYYQPDTIFIADTVFIPDTTNKLTNVTFEEKANQKVQLYPNPANDYINIQLPLSEGRLEIWSMEGRKIFEQPIIQAQQQINIQHLKPGMYAVIIQQQNKSPLKFNLIKQ
jgi:hypothetical protein